jgi:hypothetical protein
LKQEESLFGYRSADSLVREFANLKVALAILVPFNFNSSRTRLSALRCLTHRKSVFETIREKRQWHTPPRSQCGQTWLSWLAFTRIPSPFRHAWRHPFLNYRLDDAMPASRRHEWAELLKIDDELKTADKD